MGKTSRKTAWRPVSLRLLTGTSVWRNSTYVSSWISMRFGGSAPSLILPKLIRSDMSKGLWLNCCVRYFQRGEKTAGAQKAQLTSSKGKGLLRSEVSAVTGYLAGKWDRERGGEWPEPQ